MEIICKEAASLNGEAVSFCTNETILFGIVGKLVAVHIKNASHLYCYRRSMHPGYN